MQTSINLLHPTVAELLRMVLLWETLHQYITMAPQNLFCSDCKLSEYKLTFDTPYIIS